MRCNKIDIFIVILLVYIQANFTAGLQCYLCSYIENEKDNNCLLDPRSTKIYNCTKKYCTTMRQEALKPPGKVISFKRDCEDEPQYLNTVKTDSTHRFYYRSCIEDLCNDSDGLLSATPIDPNFGAAENTEIKGKDFAIPKCEIRNFLIIFGLFISMRFF